MAEFTLEPDPPVRMRERIRLEDLAGEKILYVFDSHQLDGCHALIITEEFNWVTLIVESDSCGEDATLSNGTFYGEQGLDKMVGYIDTQHLGILVQLGLNTKGEVDAISAKRRAEQADLLRARAARLRSQADALLGGG